LINLQINFTYNFKIAFLEQVVIGQYASRYGVFNRHDPAIAFLWIGGNLNNIPKSGAGDDYCMLTKKMPGCLLMKTSFITLDRYFLIHNKIKIPVFLTGILYC
jgi:hypothetical protein